MSSEKKIIQKTPLKSQYSRIYNERITRTPKSSGSLYKKAENTWQHKKYHCLN